MAEFKSEVKTFRITYQCDACGRGEMFPEGHVLTSSPPKYPHKCDRCGHRKNFCVSYPTLRTEEVGEVPLSKEDWPASGPERFFCGSTEAQIKEAIDAASPLSGSLHSRINALRTERDRLKQDALSATIKLVSFNPAKLDGEREDRKTDFVRAYHMAKQMVEDAQMELLPGSPFDMQWLLDTSVNDIRNGDLVNAAATLLAIADRTNLLSEPVPGDFSINTAPIDWMGLRDKQGCWSHPGFPWGFMDEGMNPEMILNGMGFHVKMSSMEDELEPELFDSLMTSGDYTLWVPKHPDGLGLQWFLISVSDAEDGPIALWARKMTEQESKLIRSGREEWSRDDRHA